MIHAATAPVLALLLTGLQGPDKSAYTLFNPVPRPLMREMSTDRPDTTESPFTVDAGHVQLEISFADWTESSAGSGASRSLAVAPLLLKFGLTNSVDLQVGLDPWRREVTEDRAIGASTVDTGASDTTVRLKVNLCGNDSTALTEGWAVAVMPFVSFQTEASGLGADGTEWGLIVPASLALSEQWSLGLMLELDALRDDALDSGYIFDFVQTITLSHDVTDQVGFYIEFAGFLSLSDAEDFRAYADAGSTYALTEDVQLDCGVRFGLNEASDDVGLFAGVSVRW